uniref:WAP domain-containing protein n=1 Tax=Sinocyclocheilus rhinocerous TaxID=307959 RepID=A0A673JE80_9TELE
LQRLILQQHMFVLVLWASLSAPPDAPVQLTVVPSRRGCSSDKDCPGGHKCCRFDCGPVCVLPVFNEFVNNGC